MNSRGWRIVLLLLITLSLAMNIYLLLTLLQARDNFLAALTFARAEVAALSEEPLIVEVEVDEEIPFQTVIPFEQTFTVPIDMEYPLSTVVNTSVRIPILGNQNISVPIDTVIPIQYEFEVPLQVEVPISITYHFQTTLPIEVEIPPEISSSLDMMLEQAEQGLR